MTGGNRFSAESTRITTRKCTGIDNRGICKGQKMNIAILNTLAKSGSTGKITYGFQSYLKSCGHNAYIFYGRDDSVDESEKDIIRIGSDLDVKIHGAKSRILGLQGTYSVKATRTMLVKFDELRIDAVCMFNLHGYYVNFPILFEYLGRHQIPCEYVMLDEYPLLGKCSYSYDCEKFKTECKNCPQVKEYPKSLLFDRSKKMFRIKKEAYDSAPQCVFVGIEYTVNRAKESALTKGRFFAIADEAIDLRNMYYPRQTDRLRNELEIPKGNKIIVTVTPYPNSRKGGQFFIEAARRMENIEGFSFVHVGFKADTGICPSNYIPIGYVKDQNLLAEYYSLGDLFVHTSTAETIPAAILEALACGTPILGFDASGIPFSADKEHGTFVEPNNVDEMVKVIKSTPWKDRSVIDSCRKYAESRYDNIMYYEKLLNILQKKAS